MATPGWTPYSDFGFFEADDLGMEDPFVVFEVVRVGWR
jgi:hypothetical protein